MFTRCPICQQDVPNWEYQNHVGQHGPQAFARLPVQMMPPSASPNVAPSVPNIPGYQPLPAAPSGPARQYYHPQCGGATAMPPYALQQMAADPFSLGDRVTCTGCGKQVPETEIYWSDSGQSLADYRQELKNNFVYANKLNPEDFEWDANGVSRRKSKGGVAAALVIGGVAAVVGVLLLGGIAVGMVAALGSNSNPNPAPAQGGFVGRPGYRAPTPQSGYTAAPVYTPPVYTPPSYSPPSYSPPPYPSGIESTDEFLARHRRESEQRMKESRERMEKMQRDMKRDLDDLRKRRFP